MDVRSETGSPSAAAFRLACGCIKRDYDFVLTVNAVNGIIEQVLDTPKGECLRPGMDYGQTAVKVIRQYASSEEADTLIMNTELGRVRKELAGGQAYSVRAAGKRPDGETGYWEISYRFFNTRRSEISITCQDITKRINDERHQNHRLTAALKAALEESDAKSEFLSRMSHDMRTPLNGIIGMTELALGEDISDKAREYMSEVALSGKFLLGLINDVLDWSRIENGKLELHPQPYNQQELLKYIRAVISPLCNSKNQQFIIECDDYDHGFMADTLRLNQIFFNLLSNASKYTPDGGTVRFSIRHYNAGWESLFGKVDLHFEIEDSGIGMSKAFQEYVFAPFSREETGATAQTQGTGLGLSIVRSLIEAMHGQITLESEPGKGTLVKVTLVLPVIPSGSKTNDDGSGEAGKTPEEDERDGLSGKRVLLAEDNGTNAKLLELLLEKNGMLSERAENGKEVLEMFMENEPGYYDAILMDVRMPVMDGMMATKAIRALMRADAQQIPIIAVTANAFDKDVEACIAAGMNAHLGKPIEPKKMFSALQEHCCKEKVCG